MRLRDRKDLNDLPLEQLKKIAETAPVEEIAELAEQQRHVYDAVARLSLAALIAIRDVSQADIEWSQFDTLERAQIVSMMAGRIRYELLLNAKAAGLPADIAAELASLVEENLRKFDHEVTP